MHHHTKVESDGTIVIPAKLLRQIGVRIGDIVAIDRSTHGFTIKKSG